jgi:hypothetical protein
MVIGHPLECRMAAQILTARPCMYTVSTLCRHFVQFGCGNYLPANATTLRQSLSASVRQFERNWTRSNFRLVDFDLPHSRQACSVVGFVDNKCGWISRIESVWKIRVFSQLRLYVCWLATNDAANVAGSGIFDWMRDFWRCYDVQALNGSLTFHARLQVSMAPHNHIILFS